MTPVSSCLSPDASHSSHKCAWQTPAGGFGTAKRGPLSPDGELVVQRERLRVRGVQPPHRAAHGLESAAGVSGQLHDLVENGGAEAQSLGDEALGLLRHVPGRDGELNRGHEDVRLCPADHELGVGAAAEVGVAADHVGEAEGVPQNRAREERGDRAVEAVVKPPLAEAIP